jgi:hypothetical protein
MDIILLMYCCLAYARIGISSSPVLASLHRPYWCLFIARMPVSRTPERATLVLSGILPLFVHLFIRGAFPLSRALGASCSPPLFVAADPRTPVHLSGTHKGRPYARSRRRA